MLSFLGVYAYSQTTTDIGIWLDHLPYRNGIDFHQQGGQVYCATEQGLFIYSPGEQDIQRFSKVNGLSDVGLSAIAWSEKHNLLVIGYENGNLDLLEGEAISNYPDILQSGNYPGLKRINDIQVEGDIAYISTDFGIVTFDLSLNFQERYVRETLIIGEESSTLRVLQTALTPDSIYAATDQGLLYASREDALIFSDNWQKDMSPGKTVNLITFFDNKVFINDNNPPNQDSVFYREDGVWKHFSFVDQGINSSLKGRNDFLSVTNSFSAQAYRADGTRVYNLTSQAVGEPDFNPIAALVDVNNTDAFWALTNGQGLYLNFQQFSTQNINPNSPKTKSIQAMHHDGSRLFVAPGSINEVWGPLFNTDGYFVLDEFTWSSKVPSTEEVYPDIITVISDPGDPDHYYLSSYGRGILEYANGALIRVYNDTTTDGEMLSFAGESQHRVGGFSYDDEKNLWFTNSLTDEPLCNINPEGEVTCFGLGSVAGSSTALRDILYTTEDQVWMQTRTNGIVVANFADGTLQGSTRLTGTEGEGNLPGSRILCFAEDLDGEIWIGSDEGVAVIYSPINIFEPNANYDASTPQIPQEDNPGFGDPLLGAEVVNDIEVDGANKKWFATANSGVFYTSADGTEQIYNFTEENSPLLSNNVLDIEVDGSTGMVYFGTDQGIVSFQGVATEGGTTNNDVFAYPNPVEPGYSGPILIRGLVTNAQVKITDIEGNIVFETVAEGGQALWSGNTFSGTRVASGVYIAYITDDLGQVTDVTKILVIN